MHDKDSFWSVLVTAHIASPFDPWATREVLVQSDVGGDIERLTAAAGGVSLKVRAWAVDEAIACRRVLARVKDVLGSAWTVEQHEVATAQTA